MTGLPLLHFGGASTTSVIISLGGIFLLMLIMSFAFWRGPQGERRFSGPWFTAWIKASAPRIVIAGVFCAGLFTASALSGGNSSASDPSICNAGIPALTTQPVTLERIDAGVQGLRDLADAARDGDLDRARVLIYSDAHNITHDVDPRLRPINETLARDLCLSIVALENQIVESNPDLDAIAAEAGRAAGLLAQARGLLATATATPDPFAKPGSGACETPIGAISDEPVTGERIDGAVINLRAVAEAASVGNTAPMAGLFFGNAHDITHDIDLPLRNANADLAKQLCLSILSLEIQLAGPYELSTIETEASNAADLLEEARGAMEISS